MSPLPSIEAHYKANAATEGFLGSLNRCDHRKIRIAPGNPVRGHSRLSFPHSLGQLQTPTCVCSWETIRIVLTSRTSDENRLRQVASFTGQRTCREGELRRIGQSVFMLLIQGLDHSEVKHPGTAHLVKSSTQI